MWDIAAAHDEDGDGKPDLLFQNRQTGLRGWALMDGTQYRTWVTLGTVAPEWDIVGTFPIGTGSGAPAVATDSARFTREPYRGWHFDYTDLYGTVDPNNATSFSAFFDWSTDSTFAQPQRVSATLTQVAPGVYTALARLSFIQLKVYYRAGATNPRGTTYGPIKLYEYPSPPAPSGLTAALEPGYQVRIAYTSSYTGYTVVYRLDSTNVAKGVASADGTGPLQAVDSTFPVTYSGTYRYFAKACDAYDVCGAASNVSPGITTPVLPPPGNVHLTVTGDTTNVFTVTWTDTAPQGRGYAAFLQRWYGDSFVYMKYPYYPAGTTSGTMSSLNTVLAPHTARAYVFSVASGGRWSLPSDTASAPVPAAP